MLKNSLRNGSKGKMGDNNPFSLSSHLASPQKSTRSNRCHCTNVALSEKSRVTKSYLGIAPSTIQLAQKSKLLIE